MIIPFDPADPVTTQFQAEDLRARSSTTLVTDAAGRIEFRYVAPPDDGTITADVITITAFVGGKLVELEIPVTIV